MRAYCTYFSGPTDISISNRANSPEEAGEMARFRLVKHVQSGARYKVLKTVEDENITEVEEISIERRGDMLH